MCSCHRFFGVRDTVRGIRCCKVFYTGTFFKGRGNFPPRIFGHACRNAKNNVNTRLTSLIKTGVNFIVFDIVQQYWRGGN